MNTTVTIQPPFGDLDRPAALRAIAEHNEKLPKDDEGVTIDPLPTGTDAETKASYEVVLADYTMAYHNLHIKLVAKASYEGEAKGVWEGLTAAEQEQTLNYMKTL